MPADEGTETQYQGKKMRTERRSFKNFRTQVTPLVKTPIVSNVRNLEASTHRHRFASNQAIPKISLGKQHAREQPSQQQQQPLQILHSPDAILNSFDGARPPSANFHSQQHVPLHSVDDRRLTSITSSWVYSFDSSMDSSTGACSPPRNSCSPQLGPSDSMSNRTYSPRPSSQYSTPFTISNTPTGPSTFPSVVSEPYWLAMSDLTSVYTTQTGKSKRPMFSALTVMLTPLAPNHTSCTCLYCNHIFTESPQDARSNLQRHLQESRRHNKNAGRKCPQPECVPKIPMRSDILRRHLQTLHKMSLSEADVIIDEIKASARRVDDSGIPRRRKLYDSITIV